MGGHADQQPQSVPPTRWPRNLQRERVLSIVRDCDHAVDAAQIAASNDQNLWMSLGEAA
jgi:hypothetical protein